MPVWYNYGITMNAAASYFGSDRPIAFCYLTKNNGAQGRNRTTDTMIFSQKAERQIGGPLRELPQEFKEVRKSG